MGSRLSFQTSKGQDIPKQKGSKKRMGILRLAPSRPTGVLLKIGHPSSVSFKPSQTKLVWFSFRTIFVSFSVVQNGSPEPAIHSPPAARQEGQRRTLGGGLGDDGGLVAATRGLLRHSDRIEDSFGDHEKPKSTKREV